VPDRSFKAIDDLIRQAEKAAANELDPMELVAVLIRLTGDRGADPYLLIATLVEGAVSTLARHVPPERQGDTAAATLKLFLQRLNVSGL
jgi:hypothetical protein